jgi:YVTN family beta-propeller protein
VTNSFDGTVSVIDTATQTVTATIPVSSVTSGVAVDPATHAAYVANYDDGTVSVIRARGPDRADRAHRPQPAPDPDPHRDADRRRPSAPRPAHLLHHQPHPPVHLVHQHPRRGHLRAHRRPGRTAPRRHPGQLPRKRQLPAILSNRDPAVMASPELSQPAAPPPGTRARTDSRTARPCPQRQVTP